MQNGDGLKHEAELEQYLGEREHVADVRVRPIQGVLGSEQSLRALHDADALHLFFQHVVVVGSVQCEFRVQKLTRHFP